MNIWDVCQNCQLCAGASHTDEYSLLFGNQNSSTLLIGSSSDFSKFLKDGLRDSIPLLNVALTFTTRCSFEEFVGDPEIDKCAIYTRTLTFAFAQFVMCEEAWNQLNLGHGFEVGKSVTTAIGIVHCVEDVLKLLLKSPPSGFKESGFDKVMRKQILMRKDD